MTKITGNWAISIFFRLKKIKSWRPFFCFLSVLQEKKQKTATLREDRTEKQTLEWAYSTICSCLWEWFLWVSVTQKWDFLSLFFFNAFHLPLNSHSQLFAAAVWDGNLSEGRCCAPSRGSWADGMGFLPPAREPVACLESTVWAVNTLPLKEIIRPGCVGIGWGQLLALAELPFPLSTGRSVLATDTISK